MSKVLVLNAGSSTLKSKLFNMPSETVVLEGIVERIGKEDAICTIKYDGKKLVEKRCIMDHEEAVSIIFDQIVSLGVVAKIEEITGVGHRVVHGGEYYNESVEIDEVVEARIDELSALAPLHNPANLNVYRIMKDKLPEAVHTAVFDTAFHQTMKQEAFIYPIPYSYYEKYKVRRYGFHGTSHKYISERMYEILGATDKKIITCHLGNGCSITAVDAGKSVKTTMGFTPLDGLMMGTRCGEIDPSIIQFIMEQENITIDEATSILNKESGLLGVSQISSDMRDVKESIEEGNELACLAQEMYVNKIAQKIGGYAVALGGLDGIVFTAGVGENDANMRKLVVEKLGKVFGITLNDCANNTYGEEVCISGKDSTVPVYVIPTNEELVIARDTYHFMA